MDLRARILLFCGILFVVHHAAGQYLEKIEVQLVQVDLVARDAHGLLVTDLTVEDFTVKENGKPQRITHFFNSASEEKRYPLTIAFLVDTSYSMHEKVAGLTRIDIAVQAARLVIDQLKPTDLMELIEFHGRPDVLVPFSSDLDLMREEFRTLNFRKANTAMRDAVLLSLSRLQDQSGRKVIVIFSDGMDTASRSSQEEVISKLRQSDATVLAFYSEFPNMNLPQGMGGSGQLDKAKIRAGEDALRFYAQMSGGEFFSFRKEPQLLRAMHNFRAFVGSQYTLAYSPAGGKRSELRKITVECKRKGIRLRHREGYWSS